MKQIRPESSRPTRAVVVHGQADALAALQAVRGTGCQLLLLSAPAAGSFLGPGWWLALMDILRPRLAAAGARNFLDCGLSAGRAMEALRIGLRHLVLLPECPQHEAVLARATALGAEIMTERPPSLDMAEKNADRRLAAWFQDSSAR